jgi:ABC-type polysaccharide/polyol phosphate export permease
MNWAIADVGQAISHWRIWYLMGGQDIQLRYRRSGIGAFWISITLVIFILTLAYLYAEIFRQPYLEYLVFLAGGLLAWNFISTSIVEACGAVIDGESHLRNVPLSVSVLSARVVFRNAIIFAHNLLAVAFVLVIVGAPITWNLLLLPLSFAVLGAFAFALGLVLAPICARFRDIGQVIANLTQILFFLTPIMWMPELAPTRPIFVHGNPIYNLVELIRAPVMGHAPTLNNWAVSLGVVALLLAAAVAVLGVARKRLYFWL